MSSTVQIPGKGAVALLWRVLVWFVLLGLVLVMLAAVVVPRIAGATPYSILTGSMRPHYPPGTLVVIKPADMSSISTGDVITYQLKSGDPTVVTHRVVKQGFNATGDQFVRTQGDANNVADALPVQAVQIKGKLWYAVPYLGYVNNYVTSKERNIVMIASVSFLLLYAAYMFTSAARERWRTTPRHVSS